MPKSLTWLLMKDFVCLFVCFHLQQRNKLRNQHQKDICNNPWCFYINQKFLERNARDALSVILHASWVSQTIQELFVKRIKGIKTMPKYVDLTEGTKWQWFISFDDWINLWKKMKTFQSLETDECQNYGNLSNLSCIWWVLEFASKSIEFKIQRQYWAASNLNAKSSLKNSETQNVSFKKKYHCSLSPYFT